MSIAAVLGSRNKLNLLNCARPTFCINRSWLGLGRGGDACVNVVSKASGMRIAKSIVRCLNSKYNINRERRYLILTHNNRNLKKKVPTKTQRIQNTSNRCLYTLYLLLIKNICFIVYSYPSYTLLFYCSRRQQPTIHRRSCSFPSSFLSRFSLFVSSYKNKK